MRALSLILSMSALGQEQVPQCAPDAEVLVPVERPIPIRYPPINPGPRSGEYLSSGVAIFDMETDASGAVISIGLKCATLASVLTKAASRALPHWRFQPGKALRGQVVIEMEWGE